MDEHLQQMPQQHQQKNESGVGILLPFILLFFPAMLLGYIWNIILFAKLKWKPYLTYMTMFVSMLISSVLLWLIRPSNWLVI